MNTLRRLGLVFSVGFLLYVASVIILIPSHAVAKTFSSYDFEELSRLRSFQDDNAYGATANAVRVMGRDIEKIRKEVDRDSLSWFQSFCVVSLIAIVYALLEIQRTLAQIRTNGEKKEPEPMPDLKPAPSLYDPKKFYSRPEKPIIVPKEPIKPDIPSDPSFDAALAEVTGKK